VQFREQTRIGITLGDPSGIGPEIVARAVTDLPAALRQRLVIFGDRAILARACTSSAAAAACAALACPLDTGLVPGDAPPGTPTGAGARAQLDYLEAAAAAAVRGEIAALVTAPVSKTQLVRVGFPFPGHTEFLAARCGVSEVAMMFAGPELNVVLATVHVPLAEVPRRLDADRIARVVELGAAALVRDLGVSRPRIGVVGLNPHAGEGGLFGTEEATCIAPAIAACRRSLGDAVTIEGPLVPDAAFRQAARSHGHRHDLLVAMYHDQALIPVKLIDFDLAVNVTLGLPFVRTSPDHGVAYDIAGSGRASARSFARALELAAAMAERRAAAAA
jgi:4-hydroxythreonine-4-phosphate dehydrogenase